MEDELDREVGADDGIAPRSCLVALRRWAIAGLVLCLATAAVAIGVRASAVKDDLAARVSARLVEARQDWVSVKVDGRNVTLQGIAPALGRQQEATAIAADVWGVAAVQDQTGLIPLVSPFEWAAFRDDAGLSLVGYAPTVASRAAIATAAANLFPAVPLADATELARGAPPEFGALADFALRLLANLTTGEVSLRGFEIHAEGLAADSARYERALQQLELNVPTGFSVTSGSIQPPLADPYVWALRFGPNGARLEGSVPSNEMRAMIAGLVRAAVPDLALEDRTELASGMPAGFESFVRHALTLMPGLLEGEMVLTGSRLVVSGQARTPDDFEALAELVGGARPAGLEVIGEDIRPAMAEAYVLEVLRDGAGVALIGLMPSQIARDEVLAEAQRLFGAGEVRTELQIADGAPRMDWIGAAKFALGQVAGLSIGSARITGFNYTITGSAATSESYELIQAALQRTLPASLVPDTTLVSAPIASPFRFVAAIGPDMVTLTGVVTSIEARQALAGRATSLFAPRPVTLEIRLASGEPEGFQAAALGGLQAISRLDGGRVELVNRAISLSGIAPYPGAVERIETQLRSSLPSGFTLNASLTVKPAESRVTPASCQELLTTELGTGGVKFTEGSTQIAPESEGRLDRLVAILQRCPEAAIEVGGHTDSGGTAERNRVLSELRAQSVVDYLNAAGIAGDRLSAVGYGEDHPIATNDTEEGRAQNRRIEFKVLEP